MKHRSDICSPWLGIVCSRDIPFRFSYNVSRSIFVEFLNPDKLADPYMVRQLEEEMQKIVEADIPFKRLIVAKDEAREIYASRNMHDKIEY
jgi:threonyl-tRNA synthetase